MVAFLNLTESECARKPLRDEFAMLSCTGKEIGDDIDVFESPSERDRLRAARSLVFHHQPNNNGSASRTSLGLSRSRGFGYGNVSARHAHTGL
jgi:hypothetical protein